MISGTSPAESAGPAARGRPGGASRAIALVVPERALPVSRDAGPVLAR
jgi:hypothetical protein